MVAHLSSSYQIRKSTLALVLPIDQGPTAKALHNNRWGYSAAPSRGRLTADPDNTSLC
jgi:hypothetical protein